MRTELFVIDPNNIKKHERELKNAAEIIKAGGIVAFPTETVYGLGGDGTNPYAADKIYSAKGRPSDNPLIIHVADPKDAEKYTYTCDLYYKLANRFMPGPLTIVMKAKDTIPLQTRGGLSTVAVRCPVNSIAHRLIELSECPIAAPSANLSGSPSPTSASHVIDDMNGRINVIIDGGDCEIGLESTIVKIEDDFSLTLLRPGMITVDELACIAPVSVASAVTAELAKGEVALSPGMKYRHYAPKAPLVLVDGDFSEFVSFVKGNKEDNIALICFSADETDLRTEIPNADIFVLGAKDNINEQASHLFSVLREADKHSYVKIYAPVPSKEGVGLALYNRMIRAAAHTIIKLRQDRNG